MLCIQRYSKYIVLGCIGILTVLVYWIIANCDAFNTSTTINNTSTTTDKNTNSTTTPTPTNTIASTTPANTVTATPTNTTDSTNTIASTTTDKNTNGTPTTNTIASTTPANTVTATPTNTTDSTNTIASTTTDKNTNGTPTTGTNNINNTSTNNINNTSTDNTETIKQNELDMIREWTTGVNYSTCAVTLQCTKDNLYAKSVDFIHDVWSHYNYHGRYTIDQEGSDSITEDKWIQTVINAGMEDTELFVKEGNAYDIAPCASQVLRKHQYAMGILIGEAIRRQVHIQIVLHRYILSYILHNRIELEDYKIIDPEYASKLEEYKNQVCTNGTVDTVEYQDICPNIQFGTVTPENVDKYIQKCIKEKCESTRLLNLLAFRNGFIRVVPLKIRKRISIDTLDKLLRGEYKL